MSSDAPRLTIEEVSQSGEPLAPIATCRKFVNQAGVIVRDILPITIAEWHKPKGVDEDDACYVHDHTKKLLFDTLMIHFNIPEGKTEKVKEWTLKKMATQFQSWKKTLWRKYEDEDPANFTGALEKIKHSWPAFKAYKNSSTAVARSVVNKRNAGKKKYHHRLGTGGYKSAIPKWLAFEAELVAKGITPQTLNWPERSKFWLFAHGAVLDPKTGLIVAKGKWKKKVETIVPLLIDAIDKVRKGEYHPERENDELTLALGNPEHNGRLRGFPGGTNLKEGFPDCADSYRSRGRKKQKELDRLSELERMVSGLRCQIDSISQHRAPDQQQQQVDVVQEPRRSSVGSTPLKVSAAIIEQPAAHYPVDDITEKTECELHMLMKNISFKVAVGYALPNEPGASYHLGQIPAGYARVGVDAIIPGFEALELDYPGGDDETTLGQVKHGFVLWNKKYIVLPGSAPRPPTPPSRSPPPTSPPFLPQRDPSASPSPSPATPVRSPSPATPARSPSPEPVQRSPPYKWFDAKRAVNGSPPKKRQKKPRKVETPEKLPYERTVEESEAITRAEVKAHFTKKPPPEELPSIKGLPRDKLHYTIRCLYNPPPRPSSDYERSIEKSHDSVLENRKCGKQIAQLGQQATQSLPPLKVLTDKDAHRMVPQGSVRHFPEVPYMVPYRYVQGKSLVTTEVAKLLPTRMRQLNSWYMKVAKKGIIGIMAKVRKEEHFYDDYGVQIDFSELFQLYNGLPLDKAIISIFCL